MNKLTKLASFTDLIVWQKAHKLVIAVYKITETFPSSEIFSLTNQIRRSAVSVSSNIAEGFGRRYRRDKLQFYIISRGSLTELQNQLLIARDLNYMNGNQFKEVHNLGLEVIKLLNCLISKLTI